MFFAEYVGGPRDGERTEWEWLPPEIRIPGLAEDHYARALSGAELNINEPLPSFWGVYRFDRLTFNGGSLYRKYGLDANG